MSNILIIVNILVVSIKRVSSKPQNKIQEIVAYRDMFNITKWKHAFKV